MPHIGAGDARKPVAVVGTGIAGLSAAWLLAASRRVVVYERADWLGGHAHTVDVPSKGAQLPVDTGFIVYNERNYPNFTALLDHLGIPTQASDMSFAASLDGGAFEYSGSGPNELIGQRRNLVRPRFWAMLSDLLRFYREAPRSLAQGLEPDLTLGEYLSSRRYGESFARDHLLPMGAAIWSTTVPDMLNYPAAAFIRFFASHGLLGLRDRPQWRTVVGGSRAYVRRLSERFADDIRHVAVRSIRRTPDGVQVTDANGRVERFDDVVIATHADEALGMLVDADPMERSLLGAWRYSANRAVLHRDRALMPRRRRVWASWNFIEDGRREDGSLCVTYWMNRLQNLPSGDDLFVTLNPARPPAPGSAIGEFTYHHPLFDAAALASRGRLWSLQGRRRTWFCGSHFGHGFHEDALQSGLAVAEEIGAPRRPWRIRDESGRISLGSPALAASA